MADNTDLIPWDDPIITSCVWPMCPSIVLWGASGHAAIAGAVCASILTSVFYHRAPFRVHTNWVYADYFCATVAFILSISALFQSVVGGHDDLSQLMLITTLLATAAAFGCFYAAGEAHRAGDEEGYRKHHVAWHFFVSVGQLGASSFVYYQNKYVFLV
jgi:hypothetical protein